MTPCATADGEVTITDGPYAETKEVLFSFYLLDVARPRRRDRGGRRRRRRRVRLGRDPAVVGFEPP